MCKPVIHNDNETALQQDILIHKSAIPEFFVQVSFPENQHFTVITGFAICKLAIEQKTAPHLKAIKSV